jgi:hypothetical protein
MIFHVIIIITLKSKMAKIAVIVTNQTEDIELFVPVDV